MNSFTSLSKAGANNPSLNPDLDADFIDNAPSSIESESFEQSTQHLFADPLANALDRLTIGVKAEGRATLDEQADDRKPVASAEPQDEPVEIREESLHNALGELKQISLAGYHPQEVEVGELRIRISDTPDSPPLGKSFTVLNRNGEVIAYDQEWEDFAQYVRDNAKLTAADIGSMIAVINDYVSSGQHERLDEVLHRPRIEAAAIPDTGPTVNQTATPPQATVHDEAALSTGEPVTPQSVHSPAAQPILSGQVGYIGDYKGTVGGAVGQLAGEALRGLLRFPAHFMRGLADTGLVAEADRNPAEASNAKTIKAHADEILDRARHDGFDAPPRRPVDDSVIEILDAEDIPSNADNAPDPELKITRDKGPIRSDDVDLVRSAARDFDQAVHSLMQAPEMKHAHTILDTIREKYGDNAAKHVQEKPVGEYKQALEDAQYANAEATKHVAETANRYLETVKKVSPLLMEPDEAAPDETKRLLDELEEANKRVQAANATLPKVGPLTSVSNHLEEGVKKFAEGLKTAALKVIDFIRSLFKAPELETAHANDNGPTP